MKKFKIISSIIILTIITAAIIVFGAVFRIREVDVVTKSSSNLAVSKEEIIESSKIKIGSSSLMLDKDSIIDRIEKSFAEIKVVQIRIVSVSKIEIIIKERIEFYYAKSNNFYYVLDEDLKVLRKVEIEPTNLILIDTTNLGINSNTKEKDFVGSKTQKEVFSNLFISLVSTVKIPDGEQLRYMEREDAPIYIESISFNNANTLSESYLRIIIKTKTGVLIDIAKPEEELNRKVNGCFSAYFSDQIPSNREGVIKLYYKSTGEEVLAYFSE